MERCSMNRKRDLGGMVWVASGRPESGPGSIMNGTRAIIARIGLAALRGYKASGLRVHKKTRVQPRPRILSRNYFFEGVFPLPPAPFVAGATSGNGNLFPASSLFETFGADTSPVSSEEQPDRLVSPRRNPPTKSPLNIGLVFLIKNESPLKTTLGSGRPALPRVALT